jgi:hypothetical protein
MKRHSSLSVWYLAIILVGIAVLWLPASSTGAVDDAAKVRERLFTPGQPGPKAVDLKVWTERAGDPAKPEGPTTIKVKVSEKAYLTAVYVNGNGDAIILFPNKEAADNLLLPDKEYTLFGGDSKIRLAVTDERKDARIAFYVSAKPVDLAPLAVADGDVCIRVAGSSVQDMEVLAKKIAGVIADEKFNRKIVSLDSGNAKKPSLGLMGLPTDAKSTRPMGVTGVQGVKDKILDSGKE